MTADTTYHVIVPIQTGMIVEVEGRKGLKFWEVIDLIDRDDVATASVDYDWWDMKNGWRNIDESTYVEDITNGIEVAYEEEVLV